MSDEPQPLPWWATLADEHAKRLAMRLATVFTGLLAEEMVVPYPAQSLRAPGCDATLVRVRDMVPLWTLYLGAARVELEVAAQMAVDDVIGETSVDQTLGDAGFGVPGAGSAMTPDKMWRDERGLDDGADDQS